MKIKSAQNNSANRGFTLIEIIVSLAVFIVVATIAVGAFLKILDANKQSQSLETAMNNANFALDSMVRDLRVGEDYDCYDGSLSSSVSSVAKTSCIAGQYAEPAIAFYSSQSPTNWGSCSEPAIHIYRYNPKTGFIEKAEQTACGTPIDTSTDFVPVTSAGFQIQSFDMSVMTVDPNNSSISVQPKVLIFMKASAGSNSQNQTAFTVQTSVSERIMNGQ